MSILWPFVVVLFVALLFTLTLYLVRAVAHGHDDEWETLEESIEAQTEREPAMTGRKPAGVA